MPSVGSPPSIDPCGVGAWWCRGLADARVTTPAGVFGADCHPSRACKHALPVAWQACLHAEKGQRMTWNRAGMISSRSAFATRLEPMAHQWLTLTDLDHVGATAEADLVLGLDHHFDAEAG